MNRSASSLLAIACLYGANAPAIAQQTYPDRPLRLVVPFPPDAFGKFLRSEVAQYEKAVRKADVKVD